MSSQAHGKVFGSTPNAVRICVALAACGGLVAIARAQTNAIQFRVNSSNASATLSFGLPSVAVGSGTLDRNRLIFGWAESGPLTRLGSECATQCDGVSVGPLGGEVSPTPLSVFVRRFDPTGAPMDSGDQPILVPAPPMGAGTPQSPSLSAQRQPGAATSSVRAVWWNTWTWGPSWAAACTDDCVTNALGMYGVVWPSFSQSPPPATTSNAPVRCEAHRSSVAFGSSRAVTAWVDLTDNCPTLMARIDDGSPVLLRSHYVGRDISDVTVVATASDRFVIVYRETLGDPQSTLSSVKYIRLDGTAFTGSYQVAYTDWHSPSVACFDDGSFAIAMFDFGDNNIINAGLKVRLFDAGAHPLPIGTAISIDDPLGAGTNYTIVAQGPGATNPSSTAAVLWMPGAAAGVTRVPIGKPFTPATRAVGHVFNIPLQSPTVPGPKTMGPSSQHPVVLRPDGRMACVWRSELDLGGPTTGDGNIYATVRPLPSVTCPADTDDGNTTGIPDGGVGIEDLLYYLWMYENGFAGADIDNGYAIGVQDGGVGIEDLLYYLRRYELGC